MAVTAPETALRQRIIAALTAEFEAEEITFLSDKMSDARGTDGAIGAVYPGPAAYTRPNEQVLETVAFVQLFCKWTPEVNPKQIVDPTVIETYAERARRALQRDDGPGDPADEHLWYYSVATTTYPFDPTGNVSRFLMEVRGTATNSGLVETTG